LTVSAVAENKNIDLDGIDVYVSRTTSKKHGEISKFIIEIKLKGDLTKRERILLFNSARKCDVSKLLKGDLGFDYQLLSDG